MSDISGPPLPKPVEPASKTAARATHVSKDPKQTGTHARNDKGDTSSKGDQSEAARGREPAVSISASAAHLHVGEELEETVNKVDYEGRPIIVTEEATFALRPDAGLRPGDDVKLEITEAGKKVSADLFELNGRPIDPPVKLSLVVIAVHGPGAAAAQPPAADPNQPLLPASPAKTHYGVTQVAHQGDSPDDAALASLLAAKTASVQPSSAGNPAAAKASPAAAETPHALTLNTDPLTGRNSSPDLATLIAQQQGDAAVQNKVRSEALSGQHLSISQTSAHHLLPDDGLPNQIQAAGGATTEGLGAKINAFGLDGQPHTLQLVDPTVSSVPPSQLAEVQQVRPLPPSEARTLPLPLTAFTSATATLAVVETNKGPFIAPLADTQNWTGEQVRVSQLSTGTPTEPVSQTSTPLVSYKGQLTDPSKAARHPVTIAVPEEGAATTGADTRVKAVHTVRAFLSNDGPRTDLRLETPKGEVFVTLPNHVRPAAGDIIQILPLSTAEQVPAASLPADAVANALATATASGLTSGTALSSLSAYSWPALEQSVALAAASDPAIASQIASKGAAGGGKLTSSLLFFLAAAGRTHPTSWLGAETEKLLASRNSSVLDLLKSDLGKLMPLATEGTGEWRPVLLPFDNRGGDMSLIALLLGQPQKPVDEDGGKGAPGQDPDQDEEGQRFVLEVQFSVLGPVQLDGLIKEKQFDLHLRSLLPLPETLRRDTRQLFTDALDANGYTGSLNISYGEAFPIDVDKVLQDGLVAQALPTT